MNLGNKVHINDWILALIAFGIPFSIKVGNLLLISGVLFLTYLLVKSKGQMLKTRISFEVVFPLVLFLVVFVSALFSKDFASGFKQVEKNILFPLIAITLAGIGWVKSPNTRFILKVFSIAVVCSTLILVIVAFIRFYGGDGPDVFFFHDFGAFFDLHPVYIAINLGISIFYLTGTHMANKNLKTGKKIILLLVLCFLGTCLFLCASKAVIICFTGLYCIQLFQIFKGFRFKAALLVSLIIMGFTVLKTPQLLNRFAQGLEFNIAHFSPTEEVVEAVVFSNEEKAAISDLELRYLMLKIGTFHVVDDGKLLFGYGVGDVQHYMDYYYMWYGLAPGWFEGYNLHNQYLQYTITYGVIVFLFFLSYLVYSIYQSLKNKNQLHLLFLFLVSFTFFFECLLSRNKGIVIFIFFNTLFLIQHRNENSDTGN